MLDLFILPTCPYCRKVMEYFDEKNIPYKKHDVNDKTEYQTLLHLGGRDQVPFLYDKENDVRLYESEKIIMYR